MVKKCRKVFAVAALCFLCCSTLLTGCNVPKQADVLESSSEEQSNVKLRFSWWGNDVRHAYTMDGVDMFQKQNPDIEVSYRYGEWSGYGKRTKVWMESHTEADVMQINYAWIDEYSPDGAGFYDLYELSDVIDFSNFTEDDLSFGEVNGKLNAIPIALNTEVVYYNEDLYQKYGLSLPKTWDDLFAAAKVMSKDEVYPIGMAKKHMFLFLVANYEQTTGKQLFNEDGKFIAEVEDIAYLLDFYKKLIDEKVMLSVDQFERSKFGNQTVAGSLFWVSDAGSYCEELDKNGIKVTIGDYPKAPDAKKFGWYIKPATMYAISNISENPKEAGKLLNYLLNSSNMAECQKTEKGVPVSKAAQEYLASKGYLESREYEASQKMVSEQEYMSIMIPVLENEDVINAFKSGADEYIYDKASLEETAQLIYDGMKEAMGDN